MGAWVNYRKAQKILKKIDETTRPNQTFLTMCMPTTPRGKNVTYLTQVLAAYRQQLDDPSLADTKLVVVNTRPGHHHEFEEVRRRYRGSTQLEFTELSVEVAQWVDPVKLEVDNMNNPKNIPGVSVRRQTHDLVHVMDRCSLAYSDGEYSMLLEDDFVPCKTSIKKIHETILSMQRKSNWQTLSFSAGMNGIVMRNDPTFVQLRRFLEEKYQVLPPDLLVYSSGPGYQGKDVRKGRYFFEHIGRVSSFDFRNTDKFLSMSGAARKVTCKR